MLISMTVRNIALIESLTIEFHRGMHVLSGETGAGKSILVDSINLVLGERADRSLIRSGCEKASVEALIDISDCPRAREILAEQELSDDHGLLTIQREITGERNICRVCGTIVPLAFLRRLSELLVDVHGQHEHQSLLDAKNHMGFLDSFGDAAFQQKKRRIVCALERPQPGLRRRSDTAAIQCNDFRPGIIKKRPAALRGEPPNHVLI